jgi:hypothetical protein
MSLHVFLKLGREAVAGRNSINLPLTKRDEGIFRLTKARR